MQSQFQTAISLCEQQLAATSNVEPDKEVLYLLSVAQRMNSQPQQALDTLQSLLTAFPDYGRGWQEQGYCFRALDRQQPMATAFFRATRFNPALLTAWKELEKIYQQQQQSQALTLARQHIQQLEALPRPLLGAMDLMHEGQLHKAEQVCRDFLRRHKHHPDAMMLLAELGLKLKVYHDAEFLLESCVALYPDNEAAAAAYQSMLAKLGKFTEAVALGRQRVARFPDNVSAQTALANALVGVGQLDEAISIYRELLSLNHERPALWVQLGHALKAQGALAEAIEAYEQAAVVESHFGDAYWSLANTKTYRFKPAMVEQMQQLADDDNLSLDDRIHLSFALGKALEDNQAFEPSFHYYKQGNALKKRTLKFDIARTEQALQAQAEACPASLFASPGGHDTPDPIFIVGLPRAGSTLLEQILASHSMVDGTMELHDILGIASALSNQKVPYPYNLAELPDDVCEKLGQQYIEQTQGYRAGAPFFIDKMPNNFIHIGLIKRMLPNAKIIDARREPKACCFSGFKQLFGDGQEFSYSLEDIGRYYKAYEKLMAHWQEVLPGQILTVQHEDVIADLPGQVARILAFCNLPFEESCVRFHETKRVIKTPSSEQVRQPIYTSGMHQWENFAPHLQPLLAVLSNS